MVRSAFVVFFVLLTGLAFAQYTVTWRVLDEDSQPMVGVVLSTNTSTTLITDGKGMAGGAFVSDSLIYATSHLGYEAKSDTLYLKSDTLIELALRPETQTLADLVVTAQDQQDELEVNTGLVRFGVQEISNTPYLMGEQDPIKFVQNQPGVSTGTDGNNGYFVRGGGIDQNKIELDKIELYNANHLFGFFSMFNVAAVDRIDFIKNGYPAQIGGRLSSVMQVHTRNPDMEKMKGSFGAGILSTNLSLQVPIKKARSSMLLAGRKSYFDLITQNFFSEASDINKRTDYRFSDLVYKYSFRPNEKHIVSMTAFGANDDYHYRGSAKYSNTIRWGTANVGLRWHWLFSESSDMEAYFNTGTYRQLFGAEVSDYSLTMASDIKHWKAGLTFFLDKKPHSLTYGTELTSRKIKPNQVKIFTNGQDVSFSGSDYLPSLEASIFIDERFELYENLHLGLGLRVTGFGQFGPFTRYESTENFVVLDTIHYGRGDLVKDYYTFEPRFRINYIFGHQSLRFSYDRNYQFIHLSPLSSVSLPTDIWVPSSSVIKPQDSRQLTLGYHRLAGQIKLSVAAFWKKMENQMEYRNGAIVGYSMGNNFDDAFIFGEGRSKGVEFFLQKETGAFQYQVSYTLSKTERALDEVQGGAYFPAKYDRTHDLNLVASYRYASWTFSGQFKLATGTAVTLPIAKYIIDGNVVSEYSERNAFRMPTYHRLDIAVTFSPPKKPNTRWILSVYNAYNRNNPYYMYFDVDGNVNEYRLDINLRKVSLFPVLPSLNYELNF